MSLELVPMNLKVANATIRQMHRHHLPVPGMKFALGAALAGHLVGIIVVGRPVARHFDNGLTLEVTRCATDGTRNACSFLYGHARRATFALGYRRLITYTRTDESGSSLRGAGWKQVGVRPARSWAQSSKARRREDQSEPYARVLWEVRAA